MDPSKSRRARPNVAFSGFPQQKPHLANMSFLPTEEDNAPPGTVIDSFTRRSNNQQQMSLGLFSPYSGVTYQNNRQPGINFAIPAASQISNCPSELPNLCSQLSSSHSNDSGRFLSSSSSSNSISMSSRMTPEHIIRTYSQESVGKLKIQPHHDAFDFVASDLQDRGEIGRGAFGAVNRMIHSQSQTEMAVKRIRSTVDETEQKRLLMDLDVVMRSNDCPYIVKFFGALFWEGDCWICMELMSASLDKFYRFVYHTKSFYIPEEILGKIAVATVKALDYLKEKLQIIHRDVKPSNILIDRGGNIKLCDFGISGHLVNSIAKTRDAGCQPYMAPERIDTSRSRNGYDVRSDVWSLGITLIELSTGRFPYPKWNNVFDQLTQVVKGDPPKIRNKIENLTFSDGYVHFVNMLTISDSEQRPKYGQLLSTPYLTNMTNRNVDVANYFCAVLDQMTDINLTNQSDDGASFAGFN